MDNRISIDPRVCHGKPVIRGTRVPVARVSGYLAGGMSFKDVEDDFELELDDVQAALGYAAELINQEQHYPLPR